MKRFLLLVIILLCFSFSYAQKRYPDYRSIITTKRIAVKNQKFPTDDSSFYMLPVVSDKYPELKKALCDTNLFDGESIDSVINEYKTQGIGITYFAYNITYADKEMISLQLYYETMSAYPDENQRWLTLNMHTGQAYSLKQEISSAGLKWIFDNYKALIKERIAIDKQATLGDDPDSPEHEDDRNMYSDLDKSIDDLEFEELIKNYVFSDKGIIFTTDDILPHTVHNHEPDRTWFISYKKLKLYILPGAVVLKK